MKRIAICMVMGSLIAVVSCGKTESVKKPEITAPTAAPAAEKLTPEAFLTIVKSDNLDAIKEALAKDPSIVNSISTEGVGETAIASAAFRGKTAVVDLLLQNKADPSIPDAYGVVAILGAARTNKADVIELLIKNKADVNYKKKISNQTALHYAAEYNSADAAKVLLANGADKTITDAEGKTALDRAVEKNSDKVIELLK